MYNYRYRQKKLYILPQSYFVTLYCITAQYDLTIFMTIPSKYIGTIKIKWSKVHVLWTCTCYYYCTPRVVGCSLHFSCVELTWSQNMLKASFNWDKPLCLKPFNDYVGYSADINIDYEFEWPLSTKDKYYLFCKR